MTQRIQDLTVSTMLIIGVGRVLNNITKFRIELRSILLEILLNKIERYIY